MQLPTPAFPDRLVPVEQGFAMVGVKTTKGYAEIKAGRLKVVRNGTRTFIRASEIQRYIDALDQSSVQEAA